MENDENLLAQENGEKKICYAVLVGFVLSDVHFCFSQ